MVIFVIGVPVPPNTVAIAQITESITAHTVCNAARWVQGCQCFVYRNQRAPMRNTPLLHDNYKISSLCIARQISSLIICASAFTHYVPI